MPFSLRCASHSLGIASSPNADLSQERKGIHVFQSLCSNVHSVL